MKTPVTRLRSTNPRQGSAEAERGLSVGELAARTGFSAKTLRYYEQIGLLPPPTRRASGYRVYDPSYETRLAFIGRAKRLSLSLEQIREILALRDAGREPCRHVLGVVDHQIKRVDDAIEQLAEFRKQLRSLRRETTGRRNGRAAVCRIIEHAAVGEGGAVLERWQAKHKN